MTKSIFDLHSPHPEPSTLVAFAENHLDRQSEHRADDCLETAFRKEGAHAFVFSAGKLSDSGSDPIELQSLLDAVRVVRLVSPNQ